jgi:hypothetical protein
MVGVKISKAYFSGEAASRVRRKSRSSGHDKMIPDFLSKMSHIHEQLAGGGELLFVALTPPTS